MKKLTLRLDDLRIDTFTTSGVTKEEGTVFGEACTCQTNCATCGGTCDAACPIPSEVECTWEISCDGMSCNYTCQGFQTAIPGHMCVECG